MWPPPFHFFIPNEARSLKNTHYYTAVTLNCLSFSGSASLAISNCNDVKSPFSCSLYLWFFLSIHLLLFLLNVKFSHFFIFWFFKYLIGRHLYVGRCLRWQMIHMNRDRHKKILNYNVDLQNFERCKIIWTLLHIYMYAAYPAMIELKQE